MSIPVDPKDLAGALADHDAGYLLTVSPDGRVKAVTVEPTATAEALVIEGVSRGSARNIAGNPHVTVLLPPRVHHGFTLIVDGTATVSDEQITVTPEAAVLHRPAAHADGPLPVSAADDCGNDCRPVGPADSGGDYEYDLAHEVTGAAPRQPSGPIFPAPTGSGPEQGGDYGYDLAHEVRGS
ncbi:MAG TPA: pyridoxamine 5'-phosphate oxidase family protein [Marmoricola sp.]|nr:pyridoxamine 5'-phosphate oxidase family protein [Marmoricola sp.]